MTASPKEYAADEVDSPAKFCKDFGTAVTKSRFSLRELEKRTGWSRSRISSVANSQRLPREALVVDVLTGMGIPATELEQWQERYRRLAGSTENGATAGAGDRAVGPASSGRPVAAQWRRPWLVVAVSIAVALLVGLGIGRLIATSNDEPQSTDHTSPNPPPSSKVIVVANKVATGPRDLSEDDTAAYLSSRTESRCVDVGCKLDSTEVYSGAKLTAYCQVQGEELTNGNLTVPGTEQNPGFEQSALWYGIEWSDGRHGYISGVYIESSDRGGLGLPTCE